MPYNPATLFETLSTGGGTINIDVTLPYSEYVFDGSGTLGANIVIQPSNPLPPPATITVPTTVKIFYNGNFTLNGNSITIFGHNLNAQQALDGNVTIEATYDLIASNWIVVFNQSDADTTPTVEGVNPQILGTGGGTLTLTPGIDYVWQELTGSGTLTSSWTVLSPTSVGGTTAGYFYVHYNATFNPNGNNVTIYGITLTDYQVANGNVLVFGYYDSGNDVWQAQLIANPQDIDYKGVDDSNIVGGFSFVATLVNGVSKQFQRLYGSGSLGGNAVVTYSGTFSDGQTFYILYDATTDGGGMGYTVDILGNTLTINQQLNGGVLVIAVWDASVNLFRTQLLQSPNANNNGVTDYDISGISLTVTVDNSTKQFLRLYGSGALAGNVVVNTTSTFDDGQTFYIIYDATTTGFSVDLLGVTLSAEQQLYGGVVLMAVWDASASAFRTQLLQSPVTSTYQTEVITIPVSFNSGLQCNNSFVVPYNATITELNAFVTEALSGTDDGTITMKINGTAVTTGVVTIPMSSALDTQASATPSALNIVAGGDIVSAVSAKSTAGGAALLSITLLRTP